MVFYQPFIVRYVFFIDMHGFIVEIDEFFTHLQQQAQLLRQVSEQAFAQARQSFP